MPDFLNPEFISKFFKFGIVGASGVLVDFGVTALGKEILKIQKYVSNAIGFTIAATSNYLLNRIWTFQSKNPAIAVEYTEFLGISIIGLGINTLIIYLLVSKLDKKFYRSKILAIAVVTVWNFFANNYFTFR